MSDENSNAGQELEWDSEITNTSAFIDIDDGEYDFIVDHYDRAKVGGSGKYAGQNMAAISCKIQAGDAEPTIKANIILNTNFNWKLAQFFISVGLMENKQDAKIRPDWNLVAGSRGRCRVEHRPNYNDETKTHLEITEFLVPPEGGKGKKWGSDF